MKPKDLRFVSEIDGRKPQLVFEQDGTYFVFTSMDDDERGNYHAISKWEIEQVLKEADKVDGQLFHPREIKLFRYIREPGHRESRIRAICYVLVAQKRMMLEKVGREIQFRLWQSFGQQHTRSLKAIRKITVKLQSSVGKVNNARPYWSQEYDYWEKKQSQLSPSQPEDPNIETSYRFCVNCGAKVAIKRWKKHTSIRCPKLKNGSK